MILQASIIVMFQWDIQLWYSWQNILYFEMKIKISMYFPPGRKIVIDTKKRKAENAAGP